MKNLKLKSFKRNPAFYNFGYHITSKENLSSILSQGLIPNELFDRKGVGASEGKYPKYSIEIAEYLYNGKIPIYFLTTSSLKDLPNNKLKFVIKHDKRSLILLKVDVRNFDQLPDLDFLRMDDVEFQYYKTGPNRTIPAIDFEMSGNISLKHNLSNLRKNKLEKMPPKLRKWMEPYDWGIPVTEFKTNMELTKDVIETTHTFAIAEPISAKYILEVKNFN